MSPDRLADLRTRSTSQAALFPAWEVQALLAQLDAIEVQRQEAATLAANRATELTTATAIHDKLLSRMEAAHSRAEDQHKVLLRCQDQFLSYAKAHRAKGTAEANRKAVANEMMAQLCAKGMEHGEQL